MPQSIMDKSFPATLRKHLGLAAAKKITRKNAVANFSSIEHGGQRDSSSLPSPPQVMRKYMSRAREEVQFGDLQNPVDTKGPSEQSEVPNHSEGSERAWCGHRGPRCSASETCRDPVQMRHTLAARDQADAVHYFEPYRVPPFEHHRQGWVLRPDAHVFQPFDVPEDYVHRSDSVKKHFFWDNSLGSQITDPGRYDPQVMSPHEPEQSNVTSSPAPPRFQIDGMGCYLYDDRTHGCCRIFDQRLSMRSAPSRETEPPSHRNRHIKDDGHLSSHEREEDQFLNTPDRDLSTTAQEGSGSDNCSTYRRATSETCFCDQMKSNPTAEAERGAGQGAGSIIIERQPDSMACWAGNGPANSLLVADVRPRDNAVEDSLYLELEQMMDNMDSSRSQGNHDGGKDPKLKACSTEKGENNRGHSNRNSRTNAKQPLVALEVVALQIVDIIRRGQPVTTGLDVDIGLPDVMLHLDVNADLHAIKGREKPRLNVKSKKGKRAARGGKNPTENE